MSRNKKYIPDVLSAADKKKQAKSIKEGTPRPKVAYRKRRSKWTIKADKYFGDAKSVAEMADKLGVDPEGLEKILEKGRGAYYSAGSRPNQTAESWARARLYAVLFGSKKARKVDKDIIDTYDIPLIGGAVATASPLERKTDDDYSEKVEEVIEDISFPNGKVEILGSMGFRSQRYTADYDCFQVVKANSIAEIKSQFQSIVRGIQKDPNLTIADIKLGSMEATRIIREDARIGKHGKLINYDAGKSLAKATKLLQLGLINEEEYNLARKLLIKKPNIKQLKAIIKKLRFNIIRWKPREVIAGKKDFRGIEYTLEEGFKTKSLFKMDVIAYIHGKYTEFSIIYDLRLNGKRLNYVGIDTLKTLEDDMMYYGYIGNWFKYLKRLFSYYNYMLKYKNLGVDNKRKLGEQVLKIIDVLNSDIGILYNIIQDLDVLLLMVEELGRLPNDRMKAIIDHTTDRMSNIWTSSEFLRNDAKIKGVVDKLLKAKGKDEFAKLLGGLIEKMEGIVSRHTKNLINREKIKIMR